MCCHFARKCFYFLSQSRVYNSNHKKLSSKNALRNSFPELHLLSALLTSISTHFQIVFSFSKFGKALMCPSFKWQVDSALKFLGRIQLFCSPIIDRKMNSAGNLFRLPKHNPLLQSPLQKIFFLFQWDISPSVCQLYLTSGQNSHAAHSTCQHLLPSTTWIKDCFLVNELP